MVLFFHYWPDTEPTQVQCVKLIPTLVQCISAVKPMYDFSTYKTLVDLLTDIYKYKNTT